MSNRILKRIIATFTTVLTLSMVMNTAVFASDADISRDSSGNTFIAGSKVTINEQVGNELFAAGQDVNADGTQVAGSAFIAGMDVSFRDSSVGSSVFAAGNTVTIDAEAVNNIWAAGQNVSLKNNTKAKAAYVVGNNLNVYGNYDYLFLAGSSIVFDGTVSGDAQIEGNVTFGSNAKIDGKVIVKGQKEPVIEDGAKVDNLEFELVTKESVEDNEIGDAVSKTAKKTAGFLILSKIKSFIFWALAFAIFAIVFATLFNKNLTESYDMAVKTNPLAFWLSGAIGIIAIPIAVLVLCITVVGAPAGIFVLAIYLLAFAIARVFTFASLVRELIFTHTAKRLNPIIETILAVLIAALTKVIPFVSGIVGLISKAYALGYIICLVYSKMSHGKKAEVVEAADDTDVAKA